jgi:hypothetical protein
MRRTAARQSWVKQLRGAYPSNAAGHASIVMKFFVGSVDDELRMNQVIDNMYCQSTGCLFLLIKNKMPALTHITGQPSHAHSKQLLRMVPHSQMNPFLTRGLI